jgi:hypothetical protein
VFDAWPERAVTGSAPVDHGRPDPATISESLVMAMPPGEAESVLDDLEVIGPVSCDVVRSARAVHPADPRAALLLVGWANWVTSGHEPPWPPPAWLSPGPSA